MNPCTGVMDQITNETIDGRAELTAEVSPSPKVVSQNCMADDYLSEDQGGGYKLVSHRECCPFILYHEDLRRSTQGKGDSTGTRVGGSGVHFLGGVELELG